jgi:hypothetical protein
MEPEEPIDKIDPLDPMLKMEPEDPGERDEPTGACIRPFSQQRLQPGLGGNLTRGQCVQAGARAGEENAMRRVQALVWLAAMLLPVACTAAASSTAPRGTVTGRLVFEGGPLPLNGRQPGPHPVSGTVQFINGNHRRTTVHVTSSGRFSVQLPAGRYDVLDRSPHILEVGANGVGHQTWSRAAPVTVTPHHTTKITLTFIAP